MEYGTANNGLLLKLTEGQEDFFNSGPRVPSSEFADPAHRPALRGDLYSALEQKMSYPAKRPSRPFLRGYTDLVPVLIARLVRASVA